MVAKNSNNEPDDESSQSSTHETKIRVSFHLAPNVRHHDDTPREALELPTDPIAVPSSIRKKGLSAVVNHLLDRQAEPKDKKDKKDGSDDESDDESDEDSDKLPAIPFDFLLNDKLLRMGLESAARKEGLSMEHALELQYFPARLPPRREEESEALPDWISAMDHCNFTSGNSSSGVLFVGGCDGMIRSFSTGDKGKEGFAQTGSIIAHTGPIQCLSSIRDGNHMLVATGSMDQTLVTHVYPRENEEKSLNLHAVYSGGHSNSIGSVALSPPSTQQIMASGDWDGGLAIWKVPSPSDSSGGEDNENEKLSKKRHKGNSKKSSSISLDGLTVQEVKPYRSIKAHASNISGIEWGHQSTSSSSNSSNSTSEVPTTLITGSWDHSLKVWDIERSDCILSLNGSRVVTALSRCSNSDVVATAHPDCTVRLWDMRTFGGGQSGGEKGKGSSLISDRTLRQSHKAWVSGVKWSPTDPFVLATTSHDGTLKVWDIRSSLPLHSVKAVDKKGEKSLCLAFGNGVIYSGGTDCVVKQFACKI